MSDKMTCPRCDSRTSSVLTACQEGEPCPHCGLSFAAAAEIAGPAREQVVAFIHACLNEELTWRPCASPRQLRTIRVLREIADLHGRDGDPDTASRMTLRLLASIWSDYPGYDTDWRR